MKSIRVITKVTNNKKIENPKSVGFFMFYFHATIKFNSRRQTEKAYCKHNASFRNPRKIEPHLKVSHVAL